MPDRLVVFGSGGHAKVVIDAALARRAEREIVILDDDPKKVNGCSILGIPVFGTRDQMESLRGWPVIIAIGGNQRRAELISWFRDQGHPLETVVHPCAAVAESAELGAGVFVAAGAVVIAEARIATGAIINTGATVDHDCVIGESAHIAPGSNLCGNVKIGARTLIGVGAAISPGISICDDVTVGAGTVVVRDIGCVGTFIGNPARRLR